MRIIITGGNSGVGKATAAAMAAAGHEVVIACRSVSKGRDAVKTMSGDVKVAELDLADLASVRKFAETVDWTDVLVNNAGVLGLPLTRTADGFEAHMGTNHLGVGAHAFRRPELASAPVPSDGGVQRVQIGEHAVCA
jgi:NAD(P)-dependent dehydrogenase (short-subunit alcohol dehydrogenase family)